MDPTLIVVSIITTLGGLAGMYMLQFNWTKRLDLKHKYLIKRYELAGKKKISVSSIPEPVSPLSNMSALLPLLKNLDGDQIGALVDTFTGGGFEEPLPKSEGITDTLLAFAEENPEVVKGILGGLTGGKKTETKQLPEFTTQ